MKAKLNYLPRFIARASIIIICFVLAKASVAQNEKQSGQVKPEASNEDLARQLQNPVANLISVPFQNNFDFGIGPDNGFRYTLIFEPLIPFALSEDWNLISRTFVLFIHQDNVIGNGDQAGLSDTMQSLFFSPKEPGKAGIIWGLGPVFLLPTATDDRLGSEKFGAGPTAALLKQSGGWTYGILANHIWSFAGERRREERSSTLLQPFLAHTYKNALTLAVVAESTYDWEAGHWSVPVNLLVSKVVSVGKQKMSIGLGGKYFAEGLEGGPDWGIEFVVTFLFPRKK